MNIKSWWKWVKSLQAARKWFVILILIRPIVDNFYDLKKFSALSSPLYIVGVLTPVFILMSLVSKKLPASKSSGSDLLMGGFSALLIFNCFVYYSMEVSVLALGDTIKYLTPILLYYYCRRFIQSRTDLLGILTTCLISCIFPFGLLIYEGIFNPIAVEYLTEGRGGGSRVRGGYGDIMNYAVYIVILFLSAGYFFLNNIYKKYPISFKFKTTHVLISLLLCFYGLTAIKQVSTFAVCFALFILFLSHTLRNSKGIFFVLGILLIIIPFFAKDIYVSQIDPLIHKEIAIAEGSASTDGALNGRMTRWEKYFEVWEQMPTINHFIGVASSNHPWVDIMIGGGMHSDYVRLLFLTGIIGLFFYILFLLSITINYFRFELPEKFLTLGMVVSILLWSVSTIPTMYAPVLYMVFSVFAYSVLPNNKIYR